MKTDSNDEIDLIGIFKKLYNSIKLIFYIFIVFVSIGFFVAFLSPTKYSSSTIFIPQNQETSSSSLSGVASLVGINLGNSNFGGEIPSSMYPKIAESPSYKLLLLSEIIDVEKKLTLREYINLNYDLNYENLGNTSSLEISELDEECFEILDEILSISVNQKDGFVTLSSSMEVARYSAIIVIKAREILQKTIIENKIESARQNLIFSLKQLDEKKILFNEIQSKIAYFSDSNLNSVNSFVINEKGKLEAEFEIINAVVTELSKQVEQAKLQVKKDTPVFSTIKEAVIPNKKSSPKRAQIIVIFGFLGFIFSVLYTLYFESIIKFFKAITNSWFGIIIEKSL